MAKDGSFSLKGGFGRDSGASYSVGAQDFSPAWSAGNTVSGILASQMDPLGALAAYLGIKKAAANNSGPGASPINRQANEQAARPVEALLSKLTGGGVQTGGPLIGKGSGGSPKRSSVNSSIGDGIFQNSDWEARARQRKLQQEEDDYLRQQREMERRQIALGLAQGEEDLRSQKQRNETRKNIIDPNMVRNILAKLMRSF